MTAIYRILIANRGEIAIRIARTCREMGIAPIAVYTDEDGGSPHLRACEEAIAIGPSYRDSDAILGAASLARADAVHPGYGFLSEDAEFAEACERAGLHFIGPPSQLIRRLANKAQAREFARSCGVPVIPAFEPGAPVEFPVLIKPAAGGGGRGMRLVTSPSDLDAALASARDEAARLFGDPGLLIEKYIEGARHVEVQIFGDRHGNCIHLFERDCSMQRRYQKIIEESPCPVLDAPTRERLCDAALQLASAAGYSNAGTVEFLLDRSGRFYFLEVNTRIQVEHPVTEMVTGLDLVRMQIEVASGAPLAIEPRLSGHAIEARLYAEDPANGFLPSTGDIRAWGPPLHVRVDSGIAVGQEIGIHYDPLLAKIIAHGPNRETAFRRLVSALEATEIAGVRTNRSFLIQLLDPSPELPGIWFEEAARLYRRTTVVRPLTGVPYGYRNNPLPPADSAGTVAQLISCEPSRIVISIEGISRTIGVHPIGDELWMRTARSDRVMAPPARFPPPSLSPSRGAASSPLPGKVLRILVAAGRHVTAGEPLVILEAMKMEQTVRTTINGVVQSILVEPGQVVAPGQRLVEIRAVEPTHHD